MPGSPEGNYHLHLLGRGEERIDFHAGKVEIQMPGSTNRCVGIFSKSGNQWVFQSSITHSQCLLIPSVWGIGICDLKTKMSYEYFPRTSLYWIFWGKIFGENVWDFFKEQVDYIF